MRQAKKWNLKVVEEMDKASSKEKEKKRGNVFISTNFNIIKIADLIFHPTGLYDEDEVNEYSRIIRHANVPNFEEINNLRGPDSIMVVNTMSYGPTFERHVQYYDNRSTVVGASKCSVL